MKPIAILLCFWLACLCAASGQDSATAETKRHQSEADEALPTLLPDLTKSTPITVVLDAEDSDSATILDQQFSKSRAEKWFSETESQFGGDDPVFIVCTAEAPVSTLQSWNALIRKSHNS